MFCSDPFPETVSYKIKLLGNWTVIQLFPLPDDAHTALICTLLCVFLSAPWMSGPQLQMGEKERQRKKAVKAFYQEKGCSLLASGKEFRILASQWVCSGMQSTARSSLLASPSSWHPGYQQLPAPQGCGSKSHTGTPCSPPGRTQEFQCLMQGLASAPEINHFQLKLNLTRPSLQGLAFQWARFLNISNF